MQFSWLSWFCFTFFNQSGGLPDRILSIQLGTVIHKSNSSLLDNWELCIELCLSDNRMQQLFRWFQSWFLREKSLLVCEYTEYLHFPSSMFRFQDTYVVQSYEKFQSMSDSKLATALKWSRSLVCIPGRCWQAFDINLSLHSTQGIEQGIYPYQHSSFYSTLLASNSLYVLILVGFHLAYPIHIAWKADLHALCFTIVGRRNNTKKNFPVRHNIHPHNAFN